MNTNFKYLLLGMSLSLIPTLTNAQCVATTSCSDLGYTEKSCPDGKGIKCPFGNAWACKTDDCVKNGFKYSCVGYEYSSGTGQACNDKFVSCACVSGYEWKDGKCQEVSGKNLGKCTGYAKSCKIGDILNSDGTCTSNKVNDKTPVGVVVYIGSDNCGQALALNELGEEIWGKKGADNIPLLPDYDISSAVMDFDSCENTQKIAAHGNNNQYPAAWRVVDYAPSVAPATKGKWCLPAAGVANLMMKNYNVIKTAITKAGGESLSASAGYWTSTETKCDTAFFWSYTHTELDHNDGTNNIEHNVRPIIEF